MILIFVVVFFAPLLFSICSLKIREQIRDWDYQNKSQRIPCSFSGNQPSNSEQWDIYRQSWEAPVIFDDFVKARQVGSLQFVHATNKPLGCTPCPGLLSNTNIYQENIRWREVDREACLICYWSFAFRIFKKMTHTLQYNFCTNNFITSQNLICTTSRGYKLLNVLRFKHHLHCRFLLLLFALIFASKIIENSLPFSGFLIR